MTYKEFFKSMRKGQGMEYLKAKAYASDTMQGQDFLKRFNADSKNLEKISKIKDTQERRKQLSKYIDLLD